MLAEFRRSPVELIFAPAKPTFPLRSLGLRQVFDSFCIESEGSRHWRRG